MLDTMRNHFNDYYQQLPQDITRSVVKGAIFSCGVSSLVSGDLRIGLITGALAATLSAVSGLTMPFFRKTLADSHGNLKWYHQAVSLVINLGVSQMLINNLTSYRVNLVAGAFFTVAFSLCLSGFNDQSTHSCPFYILF